MIIEIQEDRMKPGLGFATPHVSFHRDEDGVCRVIVRSDPKLEVRFTRDEFDALGEWLIRSRDD